MDQIHWLRAHCKGLDGKTVAVTGATGGIGRELCRGVLTLGGRLLLLNRDAKKTDALIRLLQEEYPRAEISCFPLDLQDMGSVNRACTYLEAHTPDILVHNAGIYQVPRFTCPTGLDNIFQVNFASPYYLTRRLLPRLSEVGGRVVVMGSIAHTNSPWDPEDPDFTRRDKYPLVYGNSKRWLMFATGELMKCFPQVSFVIAHPGITLTNISAHHPKAVFALIKGPMKVIFPSPARAVRGLLQGLTAPVPPRCWIGPRYFHIWGEPRIQPLRTCSEEESRAMGEMADRIYGDLLSQFGENS